MFFLGLPIRKSTLRFSKGNASKFHPTESVPWARVCRVLFFVGKLTTGARTAVIRNAHFGSVEKALLLAVAGAMLDFSLRSCGSLV